MGNVRTLTSDQKQRRMLQGEERRAATRARLLAAAYRLFARHGAEAPTIDDIIAEAGVARGSFYNHFQSREDLFRSVADDIATQINILISAAESDTRDPLAILVTSFRLFVHFATIEPARGWILLRTMPLVGPLNADMREVMAVQFAAALASGRLRNQPLECALDLGQGLQIMTIRRVLTDRHPDNTIAMAAETLLLALGCAPIEAKLLAAGRISADHSTSPESAKGQSAI